MKWKWKLSFLVPCIAYDKFWHYAIVYGPGRWVVVSFGQKKSDNGKLKSFKYLDMQEQRKNWLSEKIGGTSQLLTGGESGESDPWEHGSTWPRAPGLRLLSTLFPASSLHNLMYIYYSRSFITGETEFFLLFEHWSETTHSSLGGRFPREILVTETAIKG